ncbi:MAG TPA: NADH-quinone oxidoreductase subunit NuoE [Firmicutes bacterium]|nr:NADH-quinone oxidoreductase subunit NuoE [Bacillota bacterium]
MEYEHIIRDIVKRHGSSQGAAIPILQEIQHTFGYVSPAFIRLAADYSGIPASELYGIVTFYTQFRLKPVGEYLIHVCHGTACHLAGAEKISESLRLETNAPEGGTSSDGKFTIEKVACLGCCSLAPVITVNDEVYSRLTSDKVKKIVRDLRKQKKQAGKEAEQDA